MIKIMRLKLLFFGMLVVVVFTSCDNVILEPANPTEQIAVNLRADIYQTSTYVSNDQWEATDEVGLYMKKTGQPLTAAGAVYSDAANVKMNIVGQTLTSSPPIMYPASGNVDFVAYYPYTASVNPDFAVPVNIAGQEAGLPVEILYSNNATSQAPADLPVTLNFNY